MDKRPFVTKEKVEKITKIYPTPFHLYDEKESGRRRKVKEAFAWNQGFREYFAVKATPNPFLIDLLREYGCGCDCSSDTELMLCEAIGAKGRRSCFLQRYAGRGICAGGKDGRDHQSGRHYAH